MCRNSLFFAAYPEIDRPDGQSGRELKPDSGTYLHVTGVFDPDPETEKIRGETSSILRRLRGIFFDMHTAVFFQRE
jgi:hypothetical protein